MHASVKVCRYLRRHLSRANHQISGGEVVHSSTVYGHTIWDMCGGGWLFIGIQPSIGSAVCDSFYNC